MNNKKVILVTGSSRGIGETIAQYLEKKGHIVYGSSRNIPNNANVKHIALDVTNMKSCEAAIQKIMTEQGRIDVVINNAGFHLTGAAQENSIEELQAQMDLNFYGSVNIIKSVLPILMQQKAGNIINISSIGGLLSLPYTSAYNASKYALEGYTEALRLELLPFGIFVSNLEPGFVNTGTTDQSIGAPKVVIPLFAKYRTQMHQKMEKDSVKGTPMKVIAEIIEQILRSEKPKFRYKISNMSKTLPLLKALMPQSYFEKMVLKSFNLPLKIEY